jgi:nonribosomal peptide synthetase DhbF
MKKHAHKPSRLWDEFNQKAKKFDKHIAISTPTENISFQALFKTASKLTRRLEKLGIHGGDIVALIMSNGPHFVLSYLSLVKTNATIALLSPKYQPAEYIKIIEHIHPHCILTTGPNEKVLENHIPFGKR